MRVLVGKRVGHDPLKFLSMMKMAIEIFLVVADRKCSCLRNWWKPCVSLTGHSGAAEGLVAPSPFWRRVGKGGKLRLIVERAR
jgi:hypothetical protein